MSKFGQENQTLFMNLLDFTKNTAEWVKGILVAV